MSVEQNVSKKPEKPKPLPVTDEDGMEQDPAYPTGWNS